MVKREEVKKAGEEIRQESIKTYKKLKNKNNLNYREAHTLYKLEKWIREYNIPID